MPPRVKKAQVTVFVILAILMVASVSIFLYLRTFPTTVPSQFKPVEEYFIGCMENKIKMGNALLGSQAGYIEPPNFERGSEYMPFSSQLDFFGTAVPYWFYISGNNIMREQVPSLQTMEKQLSAFLNEEIKNCDFSELENKGYNITLEYVKTTVKINDQDVKVSVEAPLAVSYGDSSGRITMHEVDVKSKIGKFYKIAKSIYDKEQSELFLENYSLDVLHLYTPMTNVELSCSPKVWVKTNVEKDIKSALEANIAALKFKGSYYKINQENNYFVTELKQNVDENVNLLYSSSWNTRIEITPSDGETMIAKPVGLQQGLGILGFCYVQYHFIYDLAFPVLIQIYDNYELLQFPVVVLIDKNSPRQAKLAEGLPEAEAELCKHKNTEFTIYSFDNSLRPLEADIQFKCLNSICDIGKTKILEGESYLIANLPQCINGFILASANGYADGKTMLDTNVPGTAAVMLSKLHNLSVEASVGLAPIGKEEQMIINFISSDYSTSVAYPQQKTVKLKEGIYNVSVSAFRQGSITLGASTSRQCTKVPRSGIMGLFGMQEEKCFDVNIPSQTLTQIPFGGGKATLDLIEEELQSANKISIDASYIKTPATIMDLQDVYAEMDSSAVDISLRK